MINCTRCGAEMPKDDKFCMRCGQELSPTANKSTPKTPPDKIEEEKAEKKKPKTCMWIIIIALVLGLILIALIGIGYYVYNTYYKSTEEAEVLITDEGADISISWEMEKRLPTAFYTNQSEKLIELKVKSDKTANIKIEVEIPEITEKETKTIEVEPEEKSYDFKPPFKTEAYGPLDKAQEKYVNIKVTNEDSGEVILETSEKITILSRNDMVWVEEDGTNNMKYISKWVTKDNKEVKELVRVAAEYNEQFCGQHAMVGYLGTEEDVLCQMASIFAAMQDYYQIAYISSPESYHTSNAQSIRLPEEVIMEHSGLCIETVVLMAAALENLGMEPVIIIVPGHAWIAVKTYAGAPTYFHLETTMLDSPVLDALEQGEMNWYQNSGQATVIDIKEAREEGIQPFGQAETKKSVQ